MDDRRIAAINDIQILTLDKNVVLADLGYRCISGELQAVEAIKLGDSPLLLSRGHIG